MTYSNEQLSAFLDGELPDIEMQAIREALVTDGTLADRLAELAAVDVVIASTYETINKRPVPVGVTRLLKTDPIKVGNMLAFPFLQRFNEGIKQHVAIAASVALFVGLGLGRWLPASGQPDWHDVSTVLETLPSGISRQLASDVIIKPRLSYQVTEGQYCRQFQLDRNNRREESIACRESGQWQLAATVYVPSVDKDSVYVAASGGSPLDILLDQSIAVGPFDRSQEARLIKNSWRK